MLKECAECPSKEKPEFASAFGVLGFVGIDDVDGDLAR
jgi:hypothetical protein